MTTPVPQTFNSLGGADRTTAQIPVPASVANGDLILVQLYKESTSAVTPPAGFTLKTTVNVTGSQLHNHYIYYKHATGADSGTYDFSWTGLAWSEGKSARISGALTTGDPFGSPVNSAATDSSASSAVTPAVATLTPSSNDCLVFFFGTNFDAGANWTPPSGFTEQGTDGMAVTLATLAQSTATATGSVTATATNSAFGRSGIVAYLLPAVLDITVSATTVAATAAVPAPTLSMGTEVTAVTVAAVAAVPAPTISTGTDATVSAATVAAVASVPAPSLATDSTVSAVTVAAVAAVPAPTVSVPIDATVNATTVAAVAAVPAPSVTVPGPAFPSGPLVPRYELDIAGAWADVTSYVYQRDATIISRGRQDESADVNPTTAQLTLNNRDGRFSPRNPTGAYYGLFGRNSLLRISIEQSSGWLQINQITGSPLDVAHVSTTDKAALDITGDIDVRFEADLDSWYDSMCLVSKWTETGNQRSWALTTQGNDGTLTLWHSTDGTAAGILGVSSTVPVPITNGRLAVRATMDVSNGGNRVREFFIAPTLAGPWEQLGATRTTAGVTSIFSSSATVHVLANPNQTLTGALIRGRVYGAEIYNGIVGTRVANPDFTAQLEGATSFADSHSNTWTVNGDLDITNHDTRFIGEVTAFPTRWDVTGRDVYSPVVASGVLRRLAQGSVVGSALYRGITRDPTTISYWPMEDESNATFFGGISGGNIRVSATAQPSSDSGFACSDSIAQVGDSALAAIVNTYPNTGQATVKFLMHLPAAGLGATVTLATITTAGTAPRWDVIYSTGSSGSLSLVAKDADGTTLSTFGPSGFAINGAFVQIKVILVNNGADVDADLTSYEVGSASLNTLSGTQTSRQIGRITRVTLNPSSNTAFADTTMGHLAVTNSSAVTWEEIAQINAWAGENATDRIKRLCDEEGVTFCPIGPRGSGDSVDMGVQSSATLLDLLRQCAESDDGILFEGREFFELRFRPRKAIYSQQSDVTLTYTDHQMDLMEPVEDDQLTKNDITVTRIGGGSQRAELLVGPLSTDIPPVGVGRYDTSVSLSLEDDGDLADHANWLLHKGTVDEARFPRVDLSLESGHFPDNLEAIRRLDLGDRISILAQPTWMDQQEITQLVQGYVEEINTFRNGFGFNLSPASPWNVGVWDDHYGRSRYGNGDCTTAEALDTTETGVDVITGADSQRWSATAVPYDVIVGGEIMTVTAVTGATNTQTLTVTRSVNGVVKSHLTGQPIELVPLSYYGL